MSGSPLLGRLREGRTLSQVLVELDGTVVAGKPVRVVADEASLPYLDHVVRGFVDGPPSSDVVAVLSGEAPGGHAFRRFTISHVGAWRYSLGVFPTAFHNRQAPLAPGIPPSASEHE